MLKTYQYWILTVAGAVCVALVLVNIVLARDNRNQRVLLESRGQYIQQSAQLQRLYQEMVKALADLAVRNKDEQLRDLLSKEGVNVTVTPPAEPAPAAPAKAHHE
jgi:hypothetical protein